MSTKEMTVHKALCELKTLGDRIDKKVRNTEFIVGNKHNNEKINDKTIVQWKKDTKAEYQSLMDLIKYRNALKQAVAMSNANTKVTVCGKEYTVAEAIELKNNWIPILKDLSYKLSQNNNQVTITVDRLNELLMNKWKNCSLVRTKLLLPKKRWILEISISSSVNMTLLTQSVLKMRLKTWKILSLIIWWK